MEMHQLRYAVAVARTGNFSRAAERCHVSQPSLSQQILKLEAELGERLFERTRREVRPTPHGETFLRRAIRILEEVEAAKREAEDAKDLLTGTVTIGVIPTVAPYLLPKLIPAFMRNHPGVEVIIREEATAHLMKLLHGYEVDLGVLSLPVNGEGLETRTLLTEELLLALPPGHPLAVKKTLRSRDLEGERLIVLREGHCLGEQVLGFCNRNRVQPSISFRSAQLETLQSLVHAGMGISLVPEMATRGDRRIHPVYRRLKDGRPERTIVVAWAGRRPLGRASAAFLERITREKVRGKPGGEPAA